MTTYIVLALLVLAVANLYRKQRTETKPDTSVEDRIRKLEDAEWRRTLKEGQRK